MSQLSEQARKLAAARKRYVTTCIVCEKPIEGIKKKRYCSNTCAARAYRARKRQQNIKE